MIPLILGLIMLSAAFVLLVIAGHQRRRIGLPGGRIIYSDTRTWGAVEKPLYDAELSLTGKPDYLVEQNGRLIPVEVKSGRTPEAPYDSHIFQVAVYCLLVHRTYGKRPPCGLIHYPGRDFAVDYTPALESALLEMLDSMRSDKRRHSVGRSHEDPQRCRGCGYRDTCDQKLG
jgi:CRISPR-associated exonuclease Cas4